MPRRALPNKTIGLIDRVANGDREAAFDLAHLYRPESLREFIEFVSPEQAPSPELFESLASAYDFYCLEAA